MALTGNNLTPKFSYLGQDPTTNPTSGFKAYDPSAGVMGESEGWKYLTYRTLNPYTIPAQSLSINRKARADWVNSGKGSWADFAKQAQTPGFMASVRQGVYDEYDALFKRRDESPIYKQLSQLQKGGQINYGTKGLSAQNAMETIAARFSRYGITDLNQVGAVRQNGKTVFYSKLTGQALPDRIGYTTYGDGMTNFYLTKDAQGNVIPLSVWKDTSTKIGGLALGGLAALVAPWAIPAISSGLGVGAAAAGGIYGAGAGALTSAASGGNLLTGALTGGLGGALGGGLLGDVTGVGAAAAPTGLASLGGAAADAALGTGMITSPAGLSSLVSAAPIGTTIPAAAGGFLNPALAAGAGAAAGGALSGGLPDFDLPVQNPSSISPIGETPAVSGNGLGTVGSTPPDLGTGMITSPEGLSGLVNSQPIGTTLGAATPGTTGGYLVPSLGGEALATTAAAGGLASSSSITDWLGNVFNQGVDKFMSDPLKNTLNLVSGLSSYLGQNDQAKALEDYLKQGLSQSDPFGSQRAYYMDRLKNTYTNPEGYLKSPEYSAISKRRLEALERADAAQGRRSQYGARTEKMHEFDLENLTKERAMLAQLAGSGINPSQVSSLLGSLGTGSAQAQANAPGNLLFMLNQIFGGK